MKHGKRRHLDGLLKAVARYGARTGADEDTIKAVLRTLHGRAHNANEAGQWSLMTNQLRDTKATWNEVFASWNHERHTGNLTDWERRAIIGGGLPARQSQARRAGSSRRGATHKSTEARDGFKCGKIRPPRRQRRSG